MRRTEHGLAVPDEHVRLAVLPGTQLDHCVVADHLGGGDPQRLGASPGPPPSGTPSSADCAMLCGGSMLSAASDGRTGCTGSGSDSASPGSVTKPQPCLPFQNHDALSGRLLVDDPDGLGENYRVSSRNHGTAMASLIIHGDLSARSEALNRPQYVRPIMRPHEVLAGHERVIPNQLLTDLLHRAVKRIVEGDGGREAVAPSVRIVNLSIGAQARALARRMSPRGRLLDWLALRRGPDGDRQGGSCHRTRPLPTGQPRFLACSVCGEGWENPAGVMGPVAI